MIPCDDYRRPTGIMGGPCLNCGHAQPDHAHRARTQLTDGSPVPADRSHTEINPATGQQKGYIVLSPEERAKGFVKPVRRSYTHARCGVMTTMGTSLAETYARNPNFYSGTFCCGCNTHYDLDQFTWEPDGEPMEPSLQEAWNSGRAERQAREKAERRERRIGELERELAALRAEQP